MTKNKPKTVGEYILKAPKISQKILRKIRKEIKLRLPHVEETISYSMPGLKSQKVFFFYAAFKNHIGIYPPLKNKKLKKLLAANMNEKGNLAFPYDKEIPIKLIGDIAVEQYKEINKK